MFNLYLINSSNPSLVDKLPLILLRFQVFVSNLGNWAFHNFAKAELNCLVHFASLSSLNGFGVLVVLVAFVPETT